MTDIDFESYWIMIAFLAILYWFIHSLEKRSKRRRAEENSRQQNSSSIQPEPLVKQKKAKEHHTHQSKKKNTSYQNQDDTDINYRIDDTIKKSRAQHLVNKLPTKKNLLAYSIIFGKPKSIDPKIHDFDV